MTKNNNGNTLAEFALTFPLLIFVTLIYFDLGRYIMARASLENSASVLARNLINQRRATPTQLNAFAQGWARQKIRNAHVHLNIVPIPTHVSPANFEKEKKGAVIHLSLRQKFTPLLLRFSHVFIKAHVRRVRIT